MAQTPDPTASGTVEEPGVHVLAQPSLEHVCAGCGLIAGAEVTEDPCPECGTLAWEPHWHPFASLGSKSPTDG